MEMYMRNRTCACIRCKMNDSLGPAVMVTLGVMLLLDNLTSVVRFSTVIAMLLIVIGAVKLLQSSSSMEGHRQPGVVPASAVPPVPQQTTETSEVNHG